jgi:hypothetical protein
MRLGWLVEKLRQEPAKARELLEPYGKGFLDWYLALTPDQVDKVLTESLTQHDTLVRMTAEHYAKEWWTRDEKIFVTEIDKATENMQSLAKIVIPNWCEIDVRAHITLATLRMTRLDTMIAQYRLENGALPASLNNLPGEKPVDPFTGKALGYRVSADGKSFMVWSAGPDKVDNQGSILYNYGKSLPENAFISEGDIVSGQ